MQCQDDSADVMASWQNILMIAILPGKGVFACQLVLC